MAFQPKRDTTLESVYSLTTRELRYEIRWRTKQANENIKTMKEFDLFKQREEKLLNRARASTAYYSKTKKEFVIPKGREGEIGLGYSNKRKESLQQQLLELRGFEETTTNTLDYFWQGYSSVGEYDYDDYVEEPVFSDKVQHQYETFVDRYGDMTKQEYLDMIDTFNNVKEALKQYGYESMGGSLAAKYVESSSKGRHNFTKYVQTAKGSLSGTGTVEDLIDVLAELMKEDGVL